MKTEYLFTEEEYKLVIKIGKVIIKKYKEDRLHRKESLIDEDEYIMLAELIK